MAEAAYKEPGCSLDFTPSADVVAGDVLMYLDGRAGVSPCAILSGELGSLQVEGVAEITKASGVVILAGGQVWWDHSADAATCVPPLTDNDFYVGVAIEDVASTATKVRVLLNQKPHPIIDAHRAGDGFDTTVVLTAGTPHISSRGSSITAAFSATAEAQKLDLLSKRSFPVDADWILEAIVEVVVDADADVADLSVGVANASHASDADAITEACFVHLDMGADNNIYAESDDGTTEVAATDTTIDWAAGARFHIAIDGRDETDIQIYINGVLVLGGTTFTLAAATGPLKALFHLEKTGNDSPGEVHLDELTVRIQD